MALFYRDVKILSIFGTLKTIVNNQTHDNVIFELARTLYNRINIETIAKTFSIEEIRAAACIITDLEFSLHSYKIDSMGKKLNILNIHTDIILVSEVVKFICIYMCIVISIKYLLDDECYFFIPHTIGYRFPSQVMMIEIKILRELDWVIEKL
jgi:hypothetical protein